MSSVKTGIHSESNTFNLKEINNNDIRGEINGLLVDGEEMVQAFQTIRDQVIFTNKRIIVANVRGVTGKKICYFSYPYSKVQYFGIETAGFLDIDSELVLSFADGNELSFDFKSKVDIKKICSNISKYLL